MITIQLPAKGIYYFLLCLGTILITSCSSVRSFDHMTMKTYADIVSTSTNAPNQIVNQGNKKVTKEPHKLLKRVSRWATDDPDEIRKFLDDYRLTYAHLTNEEIWVQKTVHYLPGVVSLLNGNNPDHYFIDTAQGKRASASLVLHPKENNKPKEVYLHASLEIGINSTDSKIYHMMLQTRPSLKVPYMPLIKENQPNQDHGKSAEKMNKKDKKEVRIYKVQKTIYKYFNKKENVYVVNYIPPKASPYRRITLFIHGRK